MECKAKIWIFVTLAPTLVVAAFTFVVQFSPRVSALLAEPLLRSYSYYNTGCWLKTAPTVLILGTSMARYGIVPNLISASNDLPEGSVASIAYDASTPMTNFVIYRNLVARVGTSKTVYYTLEPWVFAAHYAKFLPVQRALWTREQWRWVRSELGIRDRYFAPWRRIFKIATCPNKEQRGCLQRLGARNGYVPKKTGRVRAKGPKSLANRLYEEIDLFGPSPVQMEYLRRIKDHVEASGGTFILVLIPKHEFYVRLYSRHTDYDARFIEMANDTLGPVRVVGSLHGSDFQLDNRHFHDQTHLSDSGARAFTKILFGNLEEHLQKNASPLQPLLSYRHPKR